VNEPIKKRLAWRTGASAPRTRRLHLGLDFGTSWSKMVLRDYDSAEPLCHVVAPSLGRARRPDYRIPSLVSHYRGRLYFGSLAQEREAAPGATAFYSIKMHAALPDAVRGPLPALPPGTTAEDLATLAISYMLQIGRAAAANYAARHSCVPMLTMTIGAPMSVLQERDRASAIFLRMARTAWGITKDDELDLSKGVVVGKAIELVAREREALQPLKDDAAIDEWVRSEAAAGVLWAMRSPAVGPGLYGCADVGAGTTDSSFFRIVEDWQGDRWVKNRVVFYGARSGAPGMDAMGELLRSRSGKPLREIRGKEEALLKRRKLFNDAEFIAVCNESFKVHHRAWADAYRKEKRQSSWMSTQAFVLGGGSTVSMLRDRLLESTWEHINPPEPRDAGSPPDIRGWDGKPYKGDATFLLVAYGLSYSGADVPLSETPDQVSELDLSRPRLSRHDVDELYPK
jgi:hypothetical protein